MKSYQRVFLYLLSVLLLTAILSPWVATLWNLIIEARPEWQEYRYPFSRIFDRLFMILAIVLFFPCRRLLRIESMSRLGLTQFPRVHRDLLLGFFIAVVSFLFIVLAMSLSQVFDPHLRFSLSVATGRILGGLLTAITVGLLEEIFFRGMIFKGLIEDVKPAVAFFTANLFFAAIHFVKPAQKQYFVDFTPWYGFDHLLHTFERLLNPIAILPGLLGLFLLGILLSYAFIRTGSLYLSIGLHSGWIFGLKTIKVYGNYSREDLGWVFGSVDPKFVSGVATWICFLAVGLIVYWMTRKRQHRSR